MIGVVVPAHDEQALIGRCLQALQVAATHPDLHAEPVLILVVLPVLIEMFSPAGRSDPVLEDDDAEEAN